MILIHGLPNVYNESLQYVLSRELSEPCKLSPEASNVGHVANEQRRDESILVLLDGSDGLQDLTLQGLNGGTAAGRTEVVLAVYNLPRGMRIRAQALRKGLRGVFFAEDTLAIVLKGIRALLKGEVWLSHDTLLELALDRTGYSLAEVADTSGLTRREIEILAHVSRGETNDEISEYLCISNHTIKTHLYNIYRKINVNNRFQASLWAAKHI